MNPLRDIVDKTYVIALNDSERIPQISRHLWGLGISWQRFSACDYRKLPSMDELVEWGFAQRLRINGKLFMPGEIACAMSHIGVWQEMLRQGHQRILVLEDDAEFHVDAGKLREVLEAAPDDYDMLHLQTSYHRTDEWAEARPRVNEHWRRGTKESAGAVGYILTIRAACLLLRQAFPIFCIADAKTALVSNTAGYNAYVADPKIMGTTGGPKQIRREGNDPDTAVS